MTRAEAARHASLVRWGKEQPFAARLAAIRAARAKKPKGGGKGKAKGKAKQTPEQRAMLKQAEAARNLAEVGDALNATDNAVLGKTGLAALADAAHGTEPNGAMADGLIKAGLAERGADGRFRLTADARAVLRGAAQGDANGVQDTLSKLNDKNLAKAAKKPKEGAAPKDDKAGASAGSLGDAIAGTAAEAAGKEAEKPKGGGGGGGKGGKDKDKEQAAKDAAKEQAKAAAQAKKEQERAAKQAQNRESVQQSLEQTSGQSLNAAAFAGLAAFADGAGGDAAMLDALAANTGMVEQDSAGGYRMTSEGRAYVRAASSGDVRAAGDAMSRAMDRLKAKAERASASAERAGQDAADEKEQTVGEAQAVIDAANHAAEQRVTQDRRRAGRNRRRARTAKNSKRSMDMTLTDYLAELRAEVKQSAQDRAMFANMGTSKGGGGKGGKPSGGQGGLYPKGPDGKRHAPDAGGGNADPHAPTAADRAAADKSASLSERSQELTSQISELRKKQDALRPSWGQTLQPKYRKEREAEHNKLEAEIQKHKAELNKVNDESQAHYSENHAAIARATRQDIIDRKAKGASRPGDDVTLRSYEERLGISKPASAPKAPDAPHAAAPDRGKARAAFTEYQGRAKEAQQLRASAIRSRAEADRAESTSPALARSLRQNAADSYERARNIEASPRHMDLLRSIEDNGFSLNSTGRGITPRRKSTSPKPGFNPSQYGKSLEDNPMPDFDTIALDIQNLADDLAAAGDDATAEIKAGARNSASDKTIIQEIYDSACDLCELAVQLGADEGMDDEAEAEDVDGGEVELIEGKDADELVNVFSLGSEIKSLGDDTIGGYAVLFGSADTHDLSDQKDYFTKSTDFWLGRFGWPRPITYHHGLDPDTRNDPIVGSWTKARVDDVGVWLEGQLDKAHRYNGAVKELIKRGYLKLSSDSAPQWVMRQRQPNGANEVTRWPLITASTTVTPAEPRMAGLSLKAILAELGNEAIDDNLQANETNERESADGRKAIDAERARRLSLQLDILALETAQ